MHRHRVSQRTGQRGSMSFGLIVLVAIGLSVWYFGWERVKSMLSFGAGSQATQVVHVEVTDLRCEDGGLGSLRGSVRNISSETLNLFVDVKATSPVYSSAGSGTRIKVNPSPLQPGKTGTFVGDGPPFDKKEGKCRVTQMFDGGRPLGFSGTTSR